MESKIDTNHKYFVDEELKLLKLRRVQLEAELTNLNLRINKLSLESDKLLNEVKNVKETK